MNLRALPYNLGLLKALAFSTFITSVLFILQNSQWFSLWDEGYLWYGVQRVLKGEVPIRDFMSYDPGRYYWLAAILSVLGDSGIVALRIGISIFQALALGIGLWLIAGTMAKKNPLFLGIAAVALSLWMFPRHKLIDISLSIMAIGVITFLLQNPTSRRFFISGICVGLIAFFGRNHGLYSAAASLGAILWILLKRDTYLTPVKVMCLWSAGVIVGYSPLFFMLGVVPDFLSAFWESVVFLFTIKATNLPLPVPWPWKVNLDLPFSLMLRDIFLGLYFVSLIAFDISMFVWICWQKHKNRFVPPALLAAAFLSIPYTHYAFSRADAGHLAQGIYPFLIGYFILIAPKSNQVRFSVSLMILVTTAWIAYYFNPEMQCFRNQNCVQVDIGQDRISIDPQVAKDVNLIKKLINNYASNDRNFVITPFWPGSYAMVERKSPMWEIYALFPRPEKFEAQEIERIKAADPAFILVYDYALDGRDDLRFKHTHPLTYRYIQDFYDRKRNFLPGYELYLNNRSTR